jgi:hypothetical protein
VAEVVVDDDVVAGLFLRFTEEEVDPNTLPGARGALNKILVIERV